MARMLYEAVSRHPVVPIGLFPILGGFGTVTITGQDEQRGVINRTEQRRYLARCGHILVRETDIGGCCAACIDELMAAHTAPATNGLAVEPLTPEQLWWSCVHCRPCHVGSCSVSGCDASGLCRIHARLIEGVYYCGPHADALELRLEEQTTGWWRTKIRRFLQSLFITGEIPPGLR